MQQQQRRRRPFSYRSDDEDSAPEVWDEQEQDDLIQTLGRQNAERNLAYARILLLLPIIGLLPYVRTALAPPTALSSWLSISSLLATAYLLAALPPSHTGMAFIENLNPPNPPSRLHAIRQPEYKGPLLQYLPYLNLTLCAILLVLGIVVRHQREDIWLGYSWLPAAIYGIIVLAKLVMGSVDPVRDLGGLRYGYKGA